jgi:sulfoxide reductase heme-binding subunit YedZ
VTPLRARHIAAATNGALALVFLGTIAVLASGADYGLERELFAIRATGYAALAALCLALSMSPLGRMLVRVPRLASARVLAPALRRSYGISAGVLALLHAALVLNTYLADDLLVLVTLPFARSGLVALIILSLLLLTSFPRLVRALRIQLWKHLHRLAYVAALLVFQHMMLSPFAPRAQTLAIFGALVAVGMLRVLPLATQKSR